MKLKYSNPPLSRIGMIIPEEKVKSGEIYYIRKNITKEKVFSTDFNDFRQLRLRRDNDCLQIYNLPELNEHILLTEQCVDWVVEDSNENNQRIDRYINPHIKYLVEIIGEAIV